VVPQVLVVLVRSVILVVLLAPVGQRTISSQSTEQQWICSKERAFKLLERTVVVVAAVVVMLALELVAVAAVPVAQPVSFG